ncbi:DUF4312 family protein [Liquorilactobacillus nagelii]|uniref:DUF4312 family protein n=1 Tax=Liquorilactobacillus nagelii TaxID=82688 RepID=UPI0039EC4638
MEKKINKIIEKQINIFGSGDSKERAISNALTQTQKKVINKAKTIVLRIEPLEVSVINLKKVIVTEHFLFIFFPRKKVQYFAELNVKVQINYLMVSEADFTVKDKSQNKFPNLFKQLRRN